MRIILIYALYSIKYGNVVVDVVPSMCCLSGLLSLLLAFYAINMELLMKENARYS
jgi:hypothetical protein